MSLDHAILGFLNYHAYTGYDLKKIFDTSVQHFWPADQSQIYRTLSRMNDRGWVEMNVIEQQDRPDRKEYSITETGRRELMEFLKGPVQISEPRSASLIQVFFAGQLSDEEVLKKFEAFANVLRVILARYSEVPDQIEPYMQDIEFQREHFFWMLTLENGLRSMRANLEWAESVMDRIKKGQVPAE